MRCVARLVFVAAALLVSIPAGAVPVVYGLTAGTITVQANQTSDNALVFNQTLDIALTSFVTWDAAGVPDVGAGGAMMDFLIDVLPSGAPHALEPGIEYGPFDMITIESSQILPGVIFNSLLVFPSGGGFIFDVGSITVDALYSASHSVSGASTPGPVAADIQNVNNMSGTVNFTTGVIQVVMDSIVMGTIDGTPFGEAGNDLIITANVNFFGDSNVVPVPEPSTGVLVAFGLVAMASVRSSAGSRSRGR